MYLIITASPNTDGLTAACGKAVMDGINSVNGNAELFDISVLKLEPCRICGNGWGTCFAEAKCVINDGVFAVLQAKIRECDGFALITPVYWSEPSERMKYFLDRFRRCEAFNKAGSAAAGKNVILIAAAGGSGHGTANCLTEMEMWCRHVGAKPFDYLGVTRFTREPMLEVIKSSGARLAAGQ
jgi:multimeric flavodoxin WrbA